MGPASVPRSPTPPPTPIPAGPPLHPPPPPPPTNRASTGQRLPQATRYLKSNFKYVNPLIR
jgi:hypothetical protein